MPRIGVHRFEIALGIWALSFVLFSASAFARRESDQIVGEVCETALHKYAGIPIADEVMRNLFSPGTVTVTEPGLSFVYDPSLPNDRLNLVVTDLDLAAETLEARYQSLSPNPHLRELIHEILKLKTDFRANLSVEVENQSVRFSFDLGAPDRGQTGGELQRATEIAVTQEDLSFQRLEIRILPGEVKLISGSEMGKVIEGRTVVKHKGASHSSYVDLLLSDVRHPVIDASDSGCKADYFLRPGVPYNRERMIEAARRLAWASDFHAANVIFRARDGESPISRP